MKTGMTHEGKEITGIEYFQQRVEDAFKTVRGSIPLARGYGSDLNQLIDKNVDDNFIITAYEMVVDTFTNTANGLDDGKFKRLKVNVNNSKVNLDVWIDFAGEEITLKGLSLDFSSFSPPIPSDPYPNSWFTGFNEPVNFGGTVYFDEVIG